MIKYQPKQKLLRMSYPVVSLNNQSIVTAAPSANDNKQKQQAPTAPKMGKIHAFDKNMNKKSSTYYIERRSGSDRRNENLIKQSKLDSRNKNDRRAPALSIQI